MGTLKKLLLSSQDKAGTGALVDDAGAAECMTNTCEVSTGLTVKRCYLGNS